MSRRKVKAERKRAVARRVNAARVEAEAVDDRKAKAIADLMWTIVNSSAYLIDDIRAALTHCPRAVVGAGRALAHGGRARGIVGPDPSVCPADHLIHAADHVDAAGDDLADTTDTGLRHLDHAIARLMLAREVTA